MSIPVPVLGSFKMVLMTPVSAVLQKLNKMILKLHISFIQESIECEIFKSETELVNEPMNPL